MNQQEMNQLGLYDVAVIGGGQQAQLLPTISPKRVIRCCCLIVQGALSPAVAPSHRVR